MDYIDWKIHEHEAKHHSDQNRLMADWEKLGQRINELETPRIITKGHMSTEWYEARIKELGDELDVKQEIIDKMIFDSLGVDDRDRRIQELEGEKKEWLLDGLNRTIKTIFWGGDRNHVTDKIIIDFTDGSTQKRKVGGIL